MATTGVVGQGWRAQVTTTGAVEPDDGSPPLRWYVAADDRWHDPAADTGVRHARIAGTAVFETRLRIPGGDAVQRVWSVADAGGCTLVTVANDSPAPIAVAFTRRDLTTSRPAPAVPVAGIDLPGESLVLPIGHRSGITVGLAHAGKGGAPLPVGVADHAAVVRGWISRTDAASRLDLPATSLVEAARSARCELLLGDVASLTADPERHLLALGELVRLGELGAAEVVAVTPDVAAAVGAVARRRHPLGRAALDAGAVVLAAADERRALADLQAIRRRTTAHPAPLIADLTDGDIAAVAAVEDQLLVGTTLFPAGIPAAWRGRDFEAHGLVAAPATRLSLAVRWHGANAAVLWELDGEEVTLHAFVDGVPWSSTAARGEALWRLDQPPPAAGDPPP